MAIEVTICCDRCTRIIDAAATAAQARTRVRRAGGKTRTRHQPEDLCPHCVKEEEEAGAPPR